MKEKLKQNFHQIIVLNENDYSFVDQNPVLLFLILIVCLESLVTPLNTVPSTR